MTVNQLIEKLRNDQNAYCSVLEFYYEEFMKDSSEAQNYFVLYGMIAGIASTGYITGMEEDELKNELRNLRIY